MRNLKALEAYLEVATLGSVTAAARQLGMSQPSVSRLVQDLERDLGQPLFERVGQRLVLTRVGMLLRNDVERALSSVGDVMTRAKSLADHQLQPLRISCVSSVGFGLLPHAWNLLPADSRGEIVTEITHPDQVRAQVRRGSVDFGAASLPLEHRDLQVRWMGYAPCVLAVPEDDPLTDENQPIALAQLRGRHMVGLSNTRGLPSRVRRCLREAGVPDAAVLTSSTMNALAHVRAGSGISVIEPISVAGDAIAGVRLLPLDTAIPYFIGVVTPNSGQPCDRGNRLIETLRETAERRVQGFVTADPLDHQDIVAQLALLEDNS